ncbi:MAG: PatB family C-S lyase [Bacteroidales bacterium]|nr:PatB family C-S lyase [Bacteroidales bacterium]
MRYNFDNPVSRQGTSSVKYDRREEVFGKEDIIPMWVADMDFCPPPSVTEAIRNRAGHEILGYSVRRQEYYDSIIRWHRQRYNWDINPGSILFSPGVVPALNIATLAFTKPGDSIIVQPPVYFPFFTAVTDHGRRLATNRLMFSDGRYRFNNERLREECRNGAKMLFLSNPHNPVGRVWTRDELLGIAEICIEYGVIIISDEIHCDLVLTGHRHTPVATLSEEIAGSTITCVAPSKTFNLAGMATSSIIIDNSGLRTRFASLIDSLHITNGNIFGTEASIAAYSEGEEWLEQLIQYLEGNIDYVTGFCSENLPVIKPVRPEATYLLWLDCREMGMTGSELNNFFVNRAGLGLNEGSTFGEGGEGFMRMNLATPLSTVKKAMNQLLAAFRDT